MVHAPQRSPPSPKRVTWEEFVALPDDDRRELIDGELVETEIPTEYHEFLVVMVAHLLTAWALENGGRVVGSGYNSRVGDRRGVMPDVQYYRAGRARQDQARTDGGPDLAVEVISPGSIRYDRVKKLEYYRRIGVPEYWIVDPEEQSLMRFVLGEHPDVPGKVWITTHALTAEDREFAPPSFPGLVIDLPQLFTMPE